MATLEIDEDTLLQHIGKASGIVAGVMSLAVVNPSILAQKFPELVEEYGQHHRAFIKDQLDLDELDDQLRDELQEYARRENLGFLARITGLPPDTIQDIMEDHDFGDSGLFGGDL